ncbi:TPA: CPBP family intramembrane metalloprotease [archaeon]|nr:CPBP family intramembrane metalloprotease [Candidatus Naiadarchaeales archaeon SRR2090153.bin1042]
MENNYFKAILIFAFVSIISFVLWKFSPNEIFASIAFQGAILLLVPLALSFVYKQRFSELGVSIERIKEIFFYSAALILISIPIMLYAARLPEFNAFYPQFFARNFPEFLKFEFLALPGFFFLEFFYRGFALQLFRKSVKNDYLAILLQNIPYFFIHYGKPAGELYYSFFAGIVLGYVCLKAKSFLPGFFAHYSGAFIFDYLNW